MITLSAVEDLKNSIISWLTSTVAKGEVGTGTTPPTENDTGLESPISGTLKNLTSYETDEEVVTFTYELDGSEADGYTISEFGLFDDAGTTLYVRRVFTGQAVTTENEIVIQSMLWLNFEVS